MSERQKLRPVDLRMVKIKGGMLFDRVRTNREVGLEYQFRQCEESGRIDNFRIAAGTKSGHFQGVFFNDTDVYKLIEAASYSLVTNPDQTLEKKLDGLIELIAAAQEKDGYLNTYFTINKKKKWADLEYRHELYCAGHLFEAAVAHYRATTKESLLKVAIKLAEHIYSVFIENQRAGVPGHPEIELALIKLYRCTGNKKYLELAQFFVDKRGAEETAFEKETDENGNPKSEYKDNKYYPPFIAAQRQKSKKYYQAHAPVREMRDIVGHAVRALYLNSAVTDLCAETGDESYKKALSKMWENMVNKRMHVTAGVGARVAGEAFGRDYELPNEHNYNETCAQIASIFWNHRMAQLEADAKYEDIIELTLFNAFLSGVALDGKKFTYANRLKSSGQYERSSWFRVACCPPNIARLLSSFGTYLYSIGKNSLYIHHYVNSEVEFAVESGQKMKLFQESNYPWEGRITVTVGLGKKDSFDLFLRIPSWVEDCEVKINGATVNERALEKGYLKMSREWQDKDTLEIDFPMEARLLASHPRIVENACHLAIKRGPVVYCLEQIDNPGINLFDVRIDPENLSFEEKFEKDLLGGVVSLSFKGYVVADSESMPLYSERRQENRQYREHTVKAVPYCVWNNRTKDKMLVWIPLV